MSTEYSLLCLENPLLDILVNGNGELLSKYDLKANDAILAEEKHQGLYAELINDFKPDFVAGGAAQNTARGAQYMLPPKSTVYIGCIGDDDYGKKLTEACEKEGVRTEYLIDPKISTGRCGVVITGQNRSMCTELGAANHYKIDHLKSPEIWKLVENAKVIYVGGYHLTVCVPAIKALAEHCAETNKPFVMNLSAPFIPQFFKDPLDETAPYWDYLLGNETEARAYAEAHSLNTTDIATIAKHLVNLEKKNSSRKRVVIITQGTDSTVVATQGDNDVKEYPVHAVSQKDVVDTTAAGDAFAAGFLAGLVESKPLEKSVNMGQWLASLCIRQTGATFPHPKQEYTSQ